MSQEMPAITSSLPAAELKPGVLVVDDLDANLLAMQGVLADLPCDLVVARSGNEALRQLLKRSFAVMLLDVQMPGMDGYEVARYARGNPLTQDVPIIFVTAMHPSDEGILRGYDAGAVDFLFKPVAAPILRGKVQVFLDLYLGRQRLGAEVEAHKKTLAELETLNDSLRHFTHAASHDLKEPLRAMQGFLKLLDEEAAQQLQADQRDYLLRSRNAAARMNALLDSLLAYARLRNPMVWTRVDMKEVAAQVKEDLAERIRATHAVVEVGPLHSVQGDASRLYQLLLNLISNAVKFHGPGEPAQVWVSSVDEGDRILFSVEDRGVGVEDKHQRAIFAPFRRLHTRSEFEGSGLGLTICQQIVEQHGGTISVEAAQPCGSRFLFTLPR